MIQLYTCFSSVFTHRIELQFGWVPVAGQKDGRFFEIFQRLETRQGYADVQAYQPVNIRWVRENLEKGKADTSGDVPVFDLTELGYDKLLGSGTIDVPVKIIVEKVSASAREKIEGAGGEIINPEPIEQE